MKNKRFAGIRSAAAGPSSLNNSSSPSNHSSPSQQTQTQSAASSQQYSDGDSTPIPSLHGNLVRNRNRRDPLEFYEQLEVLGEGSMGSVSKVRKRVEVIGGSARREFLKSHSQPKIFGLFRFFQFCPIPRRNRYRQSSSGASLSSYGVSASSPSGESGGGEVKKDFDIMSGQQNQNCFTLFCCPAQQTSDSVLAPISEDMSLPSGPMNGESYRSDVQGCWDGVFGGFCVKRSRRPQHTSDRSSSDKAIFDFDTSTEGNVLSKEDYEKIDRHVNRALKHTTSSLITYGHKDVVYALKSIHLERVSSSDFMKELKNEVSILKALDHPHIVKCYETFKYNGSLFLVLEICSGSDLYSRDPYSEQQACGIIRSMLSAVAYMHSKNITHRDLKYENIMFSGPDPDADVKIIDFGLSKKYADNSFLHDTVGTVYTMAPELLRGGYTQLADCWSLGVISFMLLSSSMPFYGKDRKQVIKKIIKGKYQFISRRWKTVSTDAKGLVVRMLQHSPDRRPSAAEALDDPWLNRMDFDSLGFAREVAVMDKVQATIQTFAGYGKLKKLALMLIAYRSTSDEIGFLRKMFERFDLRHDGEVTLEEFTAVLRDYEYTDEELEWMFRAMDLDGTGLVHYSEFLAATIESHGSISEEQVAECFDRLDNDDNGFITKEDIFDILGGDIPQSYIDDIMEEADLDLDKKISYPEFLALWNQKADEKMKKDHEDVKQRRHRRADSAMSAGSVSDFSDDSFDDSAFSFETDEIVKMLEAPDTPVSGDKHISAVNAFVLEKQRSTRDVATMAQTPRDRGNGQGKLSPAGVYA